MNMTPAQMRTKMEESGTTLETALGMLDKVQKGLENYMAQEKDTANLGTADVWHPGTQSYYRAQLLKKLTMAEALHDPAVDVPPAKTPADGIFQKIGTEVGGLVETKNVAYGNSWANAGKFLELLYPKGIQPKDFTNVLLLVRIFDKQMRIATDQNALGESPYKDIAGYGILGASLDEPPVK